MACEKEREWLKENFDDAPATELENAVDLCCGKLSMEHTYKTAGLQNTDDPDCDKALHTLAAAAICNYYTSGACPPCCSVAANLVGPIMSGGINYVVEGLGKLWDSLFGGAEDPEYGAAGDKLVAGYSKATRDLAQTLGKAWIEMRMQAFGENEGAPTEGFSFVTNDSAAGSHLDGAYPMVMDNGPGGLYVPIRRRDMDPVITHHFHSMEPEQAWTEVLLHNAAIFALADPSTNGRTWSVQGKDDRLYLPEIKENDLPKSPEQFFYFWWENFDWSEAKNWEKFAKNVTGIRWHFVQKAADRLVNDMTYVTANELDEEMSRDVLVNLAKKTQMKATLVNGSSKKSSTWTKVAVGAAVVAGAGAAVWYATKDPE